MTHSNHRRGSRESLMEDWVIFTYVRPHTTLEQKRKIRDIYSKYDPVGLTVTVMENGIRVRKRYMKGWEKRLDSGRHVSSTLEELNQISEPLGCAGVYASKESVQGVISELGEGDFGNCTVVAGIFDEVLDVTNNAPVAYSHTINMSAETFGNMSKVAEPWVLELITMCGHAFPAPNLVKHLVSRVKAGSITAEDAAVELGKQCTCNFFNVTRAAKIIKQQL